jgi:hypothetical protein
MCPLEVLYAFETTGLYFSFFSNGKKIGILVVLSAQYAG